MLLTQELKWKTYKAFLHNPISNFMLSWLLEAGSLTARLKLHCANFKVEVLRQRWGLPFNSERQKLKIPQRQWANIREVQLLCDGVPWVFARSIIPRSTASGEESMLLSIGNKPLGHLLFEHKRMQRSKFEIAKVNSIQVPERILYARRSIFFLASKPLLVSEIFTEHFPYYN